MKNYLRLISFVRPHFGGLVLATLAMVVTTLFSNSYKFLVIPLVDRIIADKPISIPDDEKIPLFIHDLVSRVNDVDRMMLMKWLIVCAVVITLVVSVSRYLQDYLMNDTSHKVIRDMRNKLYRKMVHLPLGFYSKNRSGELVSRITYDSGIVRDAISEGLMDAILQPMELMANIIILFVVRQTFNIPWSFVLTITVVLPLIAYPVIRIGKALKKISHQSQGAMADLNASLFETMNGIRVVQAFAMENYEKNKFQVFSMAYYRNMMRLVAKNLWIQPITQVVALFCGCVVAYLGGAMVISGEMSAGAFLAFFAALGSLSRPFKRLSRLHAINQTALSAAERVFKILDEENTIQNIPHAKKLEAVNRSIRFEDVEFSYESSHPVLQNINIEVKAGEVLAVVGSSGSGKTTLLNLLPRFYDPTKGRILVDGQDIKTLQIESLRGHISIVTQETILFNDTVAANIAYGRSEITQQMIEHAAKIANAHDFISGLPEKYETRVGDRGFRLSGGEKQRIAIARAILKNSPILILDEATSALDSESEKLVQEAIHNLMKDRTVLVIAHRLSTIRDANRIIVLKNGVIAEQGNHEDLLKNGAIYKKLYEMQFESAI